MENSLYFLKAMSLDQNPTSADQFELRSPALFVSDASSSWIDVWDVENSLGSDRTQSGSLLSRMMRENDLAVMLKVTGPYSPYDCSDDALSEEIGRSYPDTVSHERAVLLISLTVRS